MTIEEAILAHRALATFHADLARDCTLNITREHHNNLAEYLFLEAARLEAGGRYEPITIKENP
jgi:hypothetical protein